MSDRLKGKIAIVTGGESGIGAAVVARFRGQGAIAVSADRVVAPGPIESPMAQAFHPPAARLAWTSAAPMARDGEPGEIADAVLFLASAESSYVTGHILHVDGGFMAHGIAPKR